MKFDQLIDKMIYNVPHFFAFKYVHPFNNHLFQPALVQHDAHVDAWYEHLDRDYKLFMDEIIQRANNHKETVHCITTGLLIKDCYCGRHE